MVKNIYLVTGNLGKLKELRELFPNLLHKDLDIDEIQSFDAELVVKDKAKKAYTIIQEPVIVDDASLYLECLNQFPGPLTKFLEQRLTPVGIYDLVSKYNNFKAIVTVMTCYYDGVDFIIGKGERECVIVSPRGENGHGIDPILEYQGKTFAEMSDEEKNKVSHRYLSCLDLVNKLKEKKYFV
ncbi:MAG: non-canonical purine NTP pyrophosphatase [Cyanobium sp. MAG06]|nr:non-canonical purine NTP pyrophosphatase [Cyanobium sp. MAG06]